MSYSFSRPPTRPQCLYCYRSNTETLFNNKAHVLPQSLGRFNPDLFFRGDMVCDECDHALGKDIERPFARDSAEGVVARIHSRARSLAPVVEVDGRMFRLDITCKPFTPVNPKLVFIKALFSAHTPPTSMAIVENTDEDWYAYVNVDKAERLTPGTNEFRKNYDKLNRFRKKKIVSEVIGESDEAIERGIATLIKLGINLDQVSEIKKPDEQPISCSFEITQNISEPIARTLAKNLVFILRILRGTERLSRAAFRRRVSANLRIHQAR